ncbi:sigma 54-interacting transcriptional regulator [Sphingomonas naphthae]|uniref:Sigma 54-interacting transcriptional regulator n=1 Tax=Sphingomonas naphthae TaxID=1813468 RepID=A0ABY7TIP2_9SPHN|nr:sigma 54-interacting transcriptional regulator [Sphingomonas naphthae]WCT72898.1 sigma 54-interacting transcriptional regulator [Sphingomonas naphthae]
MANVGISAKALEACPTLVAWLAGAGIEAQAIDAATPPARESRRILHVSEKSLSRVTDLLIAVREGAPAFTASAKGFPAEIAFGLEDMAFGHALVAEFFRPAHRPACGEPASVQLLALAGRIARSDATVLLMGETGTGKEGMARFVHAESPRAAKPFIAVNCAALPETMLEAMLFGHQKGSFTGAGAAGEGLFRAADGGTLLLDEIAELPLVLQAKLLRALQEREVLPVGATQPIKVDVRIIAAGNRDLAAEVTAGRFRADLYWRLNVMALTLTPLGQRRQDIRAITAALLLRHTNPGEAFAWPTSAALDRLMAHGWAGNVRELDNVLQRALVLRAGERLEADDLMIDAAPMPTFAAAPAAIEIAAPVASNVVPLRLADAARSSEAVAIEEALAATGGHRLRAAQRLGISERTLRYRLAGLRSAAAA